jgi:peptidoglycan/LPS O-acetylase OafA/YrhL
MVEWRVRIASRNENSILGATETREGFLWQLSTPIAKYFGVASMNQIKCLTSLRFFAAAMIVVFHSVNAFRIADNSKITFPLEQGVSFFFVLSGFILTYVYPSLNGAHRVRDFYVARIARIWPAHFAAFLLLLWLIPSAGWVWKGDLGDRRSKLVACPWVGSISQLLFLFQ